MTSDALVPDAGRPSVACGEAAAEVPFWPSDPLVEFARFGFTYRQASGLARAGYGLRFIVWDGTSLPFASRLSAILTGSPFSPESSAAPRPRSPLGAT